MTLSLNILRILPELALTLGGVLVMLIEPLLAPARSRRPLGWLAAAATLASAAAALYQLRAPSGTAFYGMLQVDAFSVFFHLLISAVLLVTLLAALDYFSAAPGSAPIPHAGEFYALTLFAATGMMLMTSAADLLMVFIGLEISSIATYVLAGYRKSSLASVEAALKYFLLGSFATAFLLYGIALAFGATGATSFTGIAAGLAHSQMPLLASAALGLMLVGLAFKVSAAPFHVWTPDVYQGAPTPVVGFMSTAPKAAVFAVLIRVAYTAFPALAHRSIWIFWVLAVASMFTGNLCALAQRDVKRMLAYSSIAHAGYILAAYTACGPDAVAPILFYTAAYAAMNLGAFAVLAQASGPAESLSTIDEFAGLSSQRPILAAALSLFLLSLIGLPFTAGFLGKFYVFSAALHAGHPWLLVLGLLNSGIACFYYLRLLLALYAPAPSSRAAILRGRPARFALTLAISLCAAATLLLGLAPGRVQHLAARAASISTQ